MFKRKSLVSAVVAACLGFSFVVASAPAQANLIWGGGNLVTSSTISAASTLAFNQFNPVVVTGSSYIPVTAKNTTYAVCVVTNVGGATKLVMMMKYADGSVYAI